MILAVAATEIEMAPLQALLQQENFRSLTLVSGVGPVETAVRLVRFLTGRLDAITAVINIGVAGGYIAAVGVSGPELLDLYLAETEVFGDLGICFPDRIDPFPEVLTGRISFRMDRDLLVKASRICADHHITVKTGNFITVTGASATQARGEMLRSRFQAHCENMEGAAVARVCAEYALPVLEIRCISNLVEDRDPGHWRLQEACTKSAQAAAVLLKNLSERS
jgi:futalosine hydrolase